MANIAVAAGVFSAVYVWRTADSVRVQGLREGTAASVKRADVAVATVPQDSDSGSVGVPAGTNDLMPLHRAILAATEPGGSPRNGRATIGASGESAITYVAGGLLPNGTRIAEIYSDRVLLVKGTQSVWLYTDQKHKSDARADSMELLDLEPKAVGVAEARQELPSFSDYVRPNPIYKGEAMEGYAVTQGSRSGVFGQMGLSSGDVITQLAGIDLREPQTSGALFDRLAAGEVMTAKVIRGGEVVNMTLDGSSMFADRTRHSLSQAQVQ